MEGVIHIDARDAVHRQRARKPIELEAGVGTIAG